MLPFPSRPQRLLPPLPDCHTGPPSQLSSAKNRKRCSRTPGHCTTSCRCRPPRPRALQPNEHRIRRATGLVPSLSHSGGARGSRGNQPPHPLLQMLQRSSSPMRPCLIWVRFWTAVLTLPTSASASTRGTERERCRREDDSKGFFVSGPLPRSEWYINKIGADPYLWHYKAVFGSKAYLDGMTLFQSLFGWNDSILCLAIRTKPLYFLFGSTVK